MKHGMTPCRVIATVKLTASSSFALLRIKTVGLHKSCHRSRLNYTPLNLITCEASMHLQHRKSLLKPRRHAQTTIHCSLRLYITCSWLMYMTDQNMGDEDVTRHFRTTYHLSAEQQCRAWCEHEMFMCDFLNVYMSVNRADALERSHCLQLGPRMRVARSAHVHYAGQGSCVSNAGCTEYRSCESDLFNETTEQVREKDLNDSFTN